MRSIHSATFSKSQKDFKDTDMVNDNFVEEQQSDRISSTYKRTKYSEANLQVIIFNGF